MNKSLRLRLTIVAALFTGGILSLFLYIGWEHLKVQRHRDVDPVLSPLVHKTCMQISSPDDWDRILPQLESSFPFDLPSEGDPIHILLVDHREKEIIYRNSDILLSAITLSSYLPSEQAVENFDKTFTSNSNLRSPTQLEPIIFVPPIDTIALNGIPHRLISCSNPRYTLIMAASTNHINAPIENTLDLTLVAAPIFVLIVAAITWLIIAHALKPLTNIAQTSRKIIEGSLNERVQLKGDESSEIIEVVKIINEMIDRMERNYHQAARFSADASHELKSPLAALQGTLELALQKTDSLPDMENAVFTAYEETQKLKQIINSLLMLTRIDSGSIEADIKDVNVSVLCEELCEDTEILSEEKGIHFLKQIEQDVHLNLDPTLLRQVLNNLLTNALKYNEENGSIACRLYKRNGVECIDVENTGPAIPEDRKDSIFKRFVRLDKARSQKHIKGFGLGLNIASELARINNSKLELVQSHGGVNIFRITLPKDVPLPKQEDEPQIPAGDN
ncbi:adaptive-response sensory-kinase SasA [Rubritalea halochordaticola]|uniref:histidine kinase n=1 Tax=Rubritalea halochordaticola TaxID=714537 RepID=A0ABP9V3C2_9BACT